MARRPSRSVPLPGDPLTVRTADGVTLRGVALLPSGGAAAGPSFVVAHGMTHATGKPGTAAVITRLGRHGAVFATDLRGHGRSDGRSSVGDKETLDIDAVVATARERRPDRPVVVVGFSMGGGAAIRQAAAGDPLPDATVAVSAPSRWYVRDTAAMRRVNWLLEHPLGSLVGRAVGIRIEGTWQQVPPHPLQAAGRVRVPLLLIHGTADRYFAASHAVDLHRAAGGRSELWIEPGMGHAENGSSPDLVDRIARWAVAAVAAVSSEGVPDDAGSTGAAGAGGAVEHARRG